MERKKINSPAFFIGKGQGDDLISFGSGQPDLPPPKEVFEALNNYQCFKYCLVQGSQKLRDALSTKYEDTTPEQFVITNGASEALDLVLRALYVKGGKVAIPRPYYYSYPHNVRLAHLEVVYYDLVDGKIDIENFKAQAEGCVAVIINSPSNPTGTVQNKETLKACQKFCEEKGVLVISDNVYKDLFYTDENYCVQGPNVITIDSFSKSYSMCGFRVGYLHSWDGDLVEKIVEMKSHTSMNTSIMSQEAAYAAATKVPQGFLDETLKIWRERRNTFYQGMLDLGLDVWNPEGAFYLFPKIKNPSKACNDLYYDYNIITYDGTWFGDDTRLRFSYALDVEKIEIGLKRLKEYLKTIED
ncbi:pyridoxal phosphate-dependent aminotransferase [Patescibacteria group bacterium]|nr:pyridoxal phosphate-dependent aminotransferase [Patescibacteria group bacterium]MBU1682358.1 pyridoxal phosphate-dependent aminotransferase [Patescibacteria group bacterium]